MKLQCSPGILYKLTRIDNKSEWVQNYSLRWVWSCNAVFAESFFLSLGCLFCAPWRGWFPFVSGAAAFTPSDVSDRWKKKCDATSFIWLQSCTKKADGMHIFAEGTSQWTGLRFGQIASETLCNWSLWSSKRKFTFSHFGVKTQHWVQKGYYFNKIMRNLTLNMICRKSSKIYLACEMLKVRTVQK